MRKILIVTGSRADWGLLSHVARGLKCRSDVALEIVATGSHVERRFGFTVSEIIRDGFEVARTVSMELAGDTAADAAHAMARVASGMTDALTELAPDLVVVLGDRYEIFASASVAALLGFPIAHIHGGEKTEGAIDDSLRHAITKLSHLHFCAAKPYRDRIIQLGEGPDRVHLVGALGVDAVSNVSRLNRVEIEQRIGIPLRQPLLLVTYHPVTIEGASGGRGVEPLIAALERVAHGAVVITGVNADPAFAIINEHLRSYAGAHPNRVVLKESLGQQLYISLMAEAGAVVGNSSSGVIEAPIMGLPSVNIGTRQAGRLIPSSVINCDTDENAIAAAIKAALDPSFRSKTSPTLEFGGPGVGERIADTLTTIPLARLTRKNFYDL